MVVMRVGPERKSGVVDWGRERSIDLTTESVDARNH